MTEVECVICGIPGAQIDNSTVFSDGSFLVCNRCGRHHISLEAEMTLRKLSSKDRPILSGVTRNATENSIRLHIDDAKIDELVAMAPELDNPLALVDRLLLYAAKQEAATIGKVALNRDCDYPVIYAKNKFELDNIISLAAEMDYVETAGTSEFFIRPDGWRRIQELKKTSFDSNTAFVAMWFDSKTKKLRDAIKEALDAAGYDFVIADESDYTGDIMDFVLASIKQSQFVIADFTTEPEDKTVGGKIKAGTRGGVYYEAGYASGLGMQVIHLCKDDDESKQRLHFDVEHTNTIFWNDEELRDNKVRKLETRKTPVNPINFSEKLYDRIMMIFGPGKSKQSRNL